MEDMKKIAHALLEWFAANKRSLPWRTDYSPYAVYISEMMLQQTQMARGTEYFLRWMDRFPSIDDVAAASEDDIFACWEGLGYYGRARSLHKAAKMILEDYGGIIPADAAALESLPGIGRYTAHAIAAIAYEQDTAAVDTNFVRVLSRLFDLPAKGLRRTAERIASQMLPKGRARDFNQAVMEFGALICGKTPTCQKPALPGGQTCPCPVAVFCLAAQNGTVSIRPGTSAVKKTKFVHSAFLIAVDQRGCMLLKKRTGQSLWKNLWDMPGFEKEERYAGPFPERDIGARFPHLLGVPKYIGTVRYAYTNHKAAADYYSAHVDTASLDEPFEWKDPDGVPLPSHHRKGIALFRKITLPFDI